MTQQDSDQPPKITDMVLQKITKLNHTGNLTALLSTIDKSQFDERFIEVLDTGFQHGSYNEIVVIANWYLPKDLPSILYRGTKSSKENVHLSESKNALLVRLI